MPESYKEDGRPAQQWYWDAWFSAFDVRLCSLAARGLWIDMLGIMWKAKPRGALIINGKPADNKMLARVVNTTRTEVDKLLRELEEKNVFSRLEDGTIICRRVYYAAMEEKTLSETRAEAGRKGAEKRWQKWQADGKNGKPMANGNDKSMAKIPEVEDSKTITEEMAKTASSSSTSSSSPTSNINKEIYISLWNSFAKENRLSEIQVIEDGSARESNLRARIKKMGDQPEKFFAEFLEKIKEQPFLLGVNKDEWVVTFDWIINASNYQKIIEEQYKKRGQPRPTLWAGPKNKKEVDPF